MATAAIAAGAAPALAASPVPLGAAPMPAAPFRLRPVVVAADPTLHVDDPRSRLATGFGNSLLTLFPFAGGKFHLAAGPRLFGRPGRPHLARPETQALLPAFRAPGLRASRRMTPAMLVGYGRPEDQGLSWGIDAGVMKGRLVQGPDRIGRLNPARIDGDLARGRPAQPINELVRMTALYRF